MISWQKKTSWSSMRSPLGLLWAILLAISGMISSIFLKRPPRFLEDLLRPLVCFGNTSWIFSSMRSPFWLLLIDFPFSARRASRFPWEDFFSSKERPSRLLRKEFIVFYGKTCQSLLRQLSSSLLDFLASFKIICISIKMPSRSSKGLYEKTL